MQLWQIMSRQVIRIHPEESVAVAARTLTNYNVGILPVCGNDGRICGLVTDRDIVTRCLAAGRFPETTTVQDVMTRGVIAVRPDMDASVAAKLMGSRQIRRLPVMENGRLCGMVSLGDLVLKGEDGENAAEALGKISSNVSQR